MAAYNNLDALKAQSLPDYLLTIDRTKYNKNLIILQFCCHKQYFVIILPRNWRFSWIT